jgi:hypothetical protein
VIVLQAAFLADRAQANPDGTFMVWRGGITQVESSAFPAPVNLTLVLRLEADREDAEALHEFGMRIMLGEHEIGPWRTLPLALRVPEGEDRVYLNMVMDLRFVVQEPGVAVLESMVDDRPVPTIRLKVQAHSQAITPDESR